MNLKTLMRRHNMRQRDLAFIAGRTERSVNTWVAGRSPIPRSVELLLEALEDGRIDERWLAGKLAKHIASA